MPNYIVRGLSCTCATGTEDIDDEHYPSTSTEPGQWALHNPGEFSDAEVIAEEDVDINLPEAWDIFSAAVTKARVGVLDEGFDIDHEDLAGAIDESDSRCSGSPPSDIGGGNRDHGTAVAAIVGAKANNGCVGGSCTGVAGVIGHPSADDSLLVPVVHATAVGWDDTLEVDAGVRTFRGLPGDPAGFHDYYTPGEECLGPW